MNRFEQTRLWQTSLSAQLEPDYDASARARLRGSLEKMRERAEILAEEIAKDLPDFTVHDITHLDALWETAQLITGETYKLTPTEAFVLGAAFLIHDLGMGLAAYPGGMTWIRQQPLWKDTVSAQLRRILGRTPTVDDLETASLEITRNATAISLRQFHADRAATLALTSWRDEAGTEYHLIEDPELEQFVDQSGVVELIRYLTAESGLEEHSGPKRKPL